MNKIILAGLLLVGCFLGAQKPPRDVKQLGIKYDLEPKRGQKLTVNINLDILLYKGVVKNTRDFNQGKWDLGSFEIIPARGYYSNGQIHVPVEYQKARSLSVYVRHRKANQFSDTLFLNLPYIQEVAVIPNGGRGFFEPGQNTPFTFLEKYSDGEERINKNYTLKDSNGMEMSSIYLPVQQFIQGENSLDLFIYSEDFTKARLKYTLPINFRNHYSYLAKGANGVDGSSGDRGGSCSRDGSEGASGGHGDNGPQVNIYIRDHFFQSDSLLEVIVRNNQHDQHYFINVNGGKLHIDISGGDGGTGGDGGKGAHGTELDDGRILPPGHGGHGGYGGMGGHGGVATFYLPDYLHAHWLDIITIDNHGGSRGEGGDGGRNGIREGSLGIFRGYGNDGVDGQDGMNGPVPQIYHIPLEELNRIFASQEAQQTY